MEISNLSPQHEIQKYLIHLVLSDWLISILTRILLLIF